MKASIKVTKEKLIERIRTVQERDQVVYETRKAAALIEAEKARLLAITDSRQKADKWEVMTAEEYATEGADYRIRLPQLPDHEYVIRGLEMATDDTLTLNLDSDLAKYLR